MKLQSHTQKDILMLNSASKHVILKSSINCFSLVENNTKCSNWFN